MHAQPSILPSTASPARLLPVRTLFAALLLGAAAALGLASVTRAADPSAGVLDAADATTETVAEALAPVVSATEPVLDAASEVAGPVSETLESVGALLQPTVGQLEPALDIVRSVVESTPLADTLAPVVDAVAPIVDATEPLVRTVDPIVDSIDELAPLPLGPTLPVFDAGMSEAPDPASASSTATRIPPVAAGGVGTAHPVRLGAPPSIPAAFLPHPASPPHAGGRHAETAGAVSGVEEAAVLVVAGWGVGAAILLALLIYRPPSWRAWLPDTLGPPSSRWLAVPVPPG